MPTFGLRLYHRGRARRNPEVLNPTLTSPSSPCATSQAGERDEGDNVTSFLRQGNEVPSPTPHLPEASLQFQPCVPAAESPPTLRLDKKKKKKRHRSKSRQRDSPPWLARLMRDPPRTSENSLLQRIEQPRSSSYSPFWGETAHSRASPAVLLTPPPQTSPCCSASEKFSAEEG